MTTDDGLEDGAKREIEIKVVFSGVDIFNSSVGFRDVVLSRIERVQVWAWTL